MYESLVQLIAIVVVGVVVTARVFPSAAPVVGRSIRQLLRTYWQIVWGTPTRTLGVLGTLTVWVAVAATIRTWALLAPLTRGSLPSGNLTTLLKMWLALLATWLLTRIVATWFFRPRSMPKRRRLS